MPTGAIWEAVKRRVKRGLKVLGLYVFWQSTGWTLTVLFLAALGGIALKSILAIPLPDVGAFDFFSRPLRMLDWHVTRFFIEHPNVWALWQHLPGYDPMNPLTLLTPRWAAVISAGLMGGYLLRKKVKDDPVMAAVTVLGPVGVVNTGTMTVRHVESIAAQLTRISSPDGMTRGPGHRTHDQGGGGSANPRRGAAYVSVRAPRRVGAAGGAPCDGTLPNRWSHDRERFGRRAQSGGQPGRYLERLGIHHQGLLWRLGLAKSPQGVTISGRPGPILQPSGDRRAWRRYHGLELVSEDLFLYVGPNPTLTLVANSFSRRPAY